MTCTPCIAKLLICVVCSNVGIKCFEYTSETKSELPKVFEKLSTAGRDEIDSVPSVQETEQKCSQQSTFLDHPYADFLIAYATPEGN